MTSPISLLASLGAADPAPTPKSAEDPAKFAAALIAALQTALVPTQQPAPVAVPTGTAPEQSAQEETPGETPANAETASGGTATGAEQSGSQAVEQSSGAVTKSPGGTAGARTTGVAIKTGQSPSSARPTATDCGLLGALKGMAKGGAQSGRAAPRTTSPGRVVWTPRLVGDLPEESADRPGEQDQAPPTGSTSAAGDPSPATVPMGPTRIPVPTNGALAEGQAPVAASQVSTTARVGCGTAPASKHDKAAGAWQVDSRATEPAPEAPRPQVWRPIVAGTTPVPQPVAPIVPTISKDQTEGSEFCGGSAGSSNSVAMSDTATDRRAGVATAPAQAAPTEDPRDMGRATGDAGVQGGQAEPEATRSDLGFVQAVARILGDVDISDVKVTRGTASAVAVFNATARKSGVEASTPALPGMRTAQAPVTEEKADATSLTTQSRTDAITAQGVDHQAAPGAKHTRTTAAPNEESNRPAALPEVRTPSNAAPRTVDDVIARLTADQIPVVEQPKAPAHGPLGVPTLPKSRQVLPASSDRSARDSGSELTEQPERPRATSDVQAGASAAPPAQTESTAKIAGRPHEVVSSEARNLRDAGSAKEQPAGVADRVTLRVADADGRQTRIRVAVLGDQVRAVIQAPDGEAAGHLERRMDELQAALVRQGFVNPKVTVQVAATSIEAGSPWGGAAAGGSVETAPSRGTDQPAGDQRQGSGRQPGRQGDGQSHSRQRSPERDPRDHRR